MAYRTGDAREAEASIRSFWQARAHGAQEAALHYRRAEALAAENEILRHELRLTLEQLHAQQNRKVVRAADKIKSLRSRPVPPPQTPIALAPTTAVAPAFSVLVTVYNKGQLLAKAVESVYAQTLPDWELLIWDDGSTDAETLDTLSDIDGPNTHIFTSENQGVIKARQALAERAHGEFFIFLDADDELRPTYLEKALLTFTRFPTVDIVVPSVKVVSDSKDVPDLWMPAHFEEKRLAYENTTPISSAFRARLWNEVGGMADDMATGYEDWDFWRRCAHHGAQGWVLDDALFLYRHSVTTGRDAEQRHRNDTLVRDIKQRTPRIAFPARPIDAVPGAVTCEIEERVFHVAHDERRSLVVFVPWILVGGGADQFLKTTLTGLADDMNVIVIGTEEIPAGHRFDLNAFLDITPFVYHLPLLLPREDFPAMVQSLMYRMTEPAILQMGSPWAYEHMAQIKTWTRGFGPAVDIQFNHIGHVAELLETVDCFDEVLASNSHLQGLLTDYFEVPLPVNVMYVAPPEPSVLPKRAAQRDRPLVGWLGRNSPEKRPDLVAEIAAASPDLDFVIAGGGFEGLIPPVPNLRVVGFVEDAYEFLAGLDLLLNTSDAEGISVSAMEALQVGVPVATRDVGGMTELITDGYNGLVYESRDIAGLAARLSDASVLRAIQQTADEQRLPAEFHEVTMIDTVRRAVEQKVWHG